MLKRNKKKCDKIEMYNLEKESVEFKISSEVFTKTLNSLLENESVIVSTFRNHVRASLPKENFQEIETEKENIKEQFHQFKNDFLDEFNEFKANFFHNILKSTPKNTGNQEHIITLLLSNIKFLKDQLHQKGKVIDSLIDQFSQKNNDIFQKINTDNQLETNLEIVKLKKKKKKTEKNKGYRKQQQNKRHWRKRQSKKLRNNQQSQ